MTMRFWEILKGQARLREDKVTGAPNVETLPEYSYVKLIRPFGSLPEGAEGTIVMIYPKTHTYMVEFFAPTRALETVDMNMVAPSANGAHAAVFTAKKRLMRLTWCIGATKTT